jgi:uncharacterized protein
VSTPLEVWRFRDGKAGHERQTAGLLAALGALRSLRVQEIAVSSLRAPWWHWLRGSWPFPTLNESPALLVGAGRACQWPLLAARRHFGGRTIYCMKPALPARCFDLCLIPAHDGAERSTHVEPTCGVLNDVQPHSGARQAHTLLLIGGPSRHHQWDEPALLKQVASIIFGSPTRDFIIADSRRTPASTRTALATFVQPGVVYQSSTTSPADWLPRALSSAHAAWVTADSVSMIFEALTAGLGVGLLEVPARKVDRIAALAASLIKQRQVTSFKGWLQGQPLRAATPPLAEAARCAALILARWP